MEIYVATGHYKNVKTSVIDGVSLDTVVHIIERIPQESIDSYNRVHLWGIPSNSHRSVKYWLKVKRGDILIIRPFSGKSRKDDINVYITVVVDKYPSLSLPPDELDKARQLSRSIWQQYRNISEFPYLIFIRGNVMSIPLKEVSDILGLRYESFLIGYRQSLMRLNSRKVRKEGIKELLKMVLSLPEAFKIYELLEEAYIELSKEYGWDYLGAPYGAPIHAGGRHIWGQEGLYEKLNEKLASLGYRELTWNEYRELLRRLQEPEYYGKIYVTFHIAPNGRVEPHDIVIYRPIFKKNTHYLTS